jgi:hypothetical protein
MKRENPIQTNLKFKKCCCSFAYTHFTVSFSAAATELPRREEEKTGKVFR